MKPQYKEARWSTHGTSDLPEALSYDTIKILLSRKQMQIFQLLKNLYLAIVF